MLINQEFINRLTPVEVSFLRIGIDKLYKEKVRPDTHRLSSLMKRQPTWIRKTSMISWRQSGH